MLIIHVIFCNVRYILCCWSPSLSLSSGREEMAPWFFHAGTKFIMFASMLPYTNIGNKRPFKLTPAMAYHINIHTFTYERYHSPFEKCFKNVYRHIHLAVVDLNLFLGFSSVNLLMIHEVLRQRIRVRFKSRICMDVKALPMNHHMRTTMCTPVTCIQRKHLQLYMNMQQIMLIFHCSFTYQCKIAMLHIRSHPIFSHSM